MPEEKKRARINFKNLLVISFIIVLYFIAFFLGGYYALTPTIYLAGFLVISVISAWAVSYYYPTKDLLCLVTAATLVALVDEYAHTSVGTIFYFDQAVPSPLKILSWSIFLLSIIELANFLGKIRVWEKTYPKIMRTLPVFVCLIPLLIVMVAQGYIYTFNWVIILVYVVLFAASFIYTSVHTLKWNFMFMISSLIFGLIFEYLGSWQGLWTFGFNEPISLLILFSWPIRIWTVSLFCCLLGVDFGVPTYEPKVLVDEQSYEEICSGKSMIVVADTHFGLYTDDEACDPNAFADFLKWLKELETKNQFLDVGDWVPESVGKKLELKPPKKLILLGDILELWTASNESIFASIMYVLPLLSELNCEKIYLLGNHDNDLIGIRGKYPLGASDIKIIEEDEYWIYGQNEDFCFLHGHQFDRGFSLPAWKSISLIRKTALVFGNYTVLLAALFFFNIGLCIAGFGGVANIMLTVLLGLVSVPFIFIKFARKVFNKLKTIKFNPEAALESADRNIFYRIWETEGPFFNVVYGHTHTIDDWKIRDTTGGVEEDLGTVMNLPSWVRDLEPKRKKESVLERWRIMKPPSEIKKEISNVFLYLSEDYPPLFIGWDSSKKQGKKLYYIPNDVIYNKRAFGNLSDSRGGYENTLINNTNVDQKLAEINWPKELISRWMKDSKN
jgi:UDP-2,3-diacylglucosamine pyrophosphatase LpxH